MGEMAIIGNAILKRGKRYGGNSTSLASGFEANTRVLSRRQFTRYKGACQSGKGASWPSNIFVKLYGKFAPSLKKVFLSILLPSGFQGESCVSCEKDPFNKVSRLQALFHCLCLKYQEIRHVSVTCDSWNFASEMLNVPTTDHSGILDTSKFEVLKHFG